MIIEGNWKSFPQQLWAIVLQDVGIHNTLAKQPVSVLNKLIKTKAACLGVTGSLWKCIQAWNWHIFFITEGINGQWDSSEGRAGGLIDLLAARRPGLPVFGFRSCCLLSLCGFVNLKMCPRNKACPQTFHLHLTTSPATSKIYWPFFVCHFSSIKTF